MQYLHQAGLLAIVPVLVGSVLIPPAVGAELAVGRSLGLNLPDPAHLAWVTIRPPKPVLCLSAPGTGRGRDRSRHSRVRP